MALIKVRVVAQSGATPRTADVFAFAGHPLCPLSIYGVRDNELLIVWSR